MLHIMHGNQESLHSVDNIWKLGKEVGDNIHADQVGSLPKGVTPGSEDAFSRGIPEACPCLMQVAVEADVPKKRPVSEDRWTKEAATICPLPGGLLRKACNVR